MFNWIKEYIASPTHKWWVDNVWRPSWTRLWAGIYGIPSALLAAWNSIAQLAGDDHISQFMAKLNVPNWVPVTLAGIALVSYLAHGRKD